MQLKKLQPATLAEALKNMAVGETRLAPDHYKAITVTKTCTELKAEGYLFQTSTRSGAQTITRLK